MSFPCTACGACCRHVDQSRLTDWLDRGDGACRHLDDAAGLCRIYAERPLVCRIDEAQALLAPDMARDDYLAANARACNALQVLHGIPDHKRIIIAGS